MKRAVFVEDLGGGAARYRLSEPWEGYNYVVVTPLPFPDGQEVTHIYAASESGPVTAVGDAKHPLRLLQTINGHLNVGEALGRTGWQVVE